MFTGSVRRYTSEDIATFEEALRGAHDKAQAVLNETRASTRLEVWYSIQQKYDMHVLY